MASRPSTLVELRPAARVEHRARRAGAQRPTELPGSARASWCWQALVSLIGLALLSPLFLLVALLIKLTSPGPVFYRGARVGYGMRVFKIYKFRTMVPDAEAKIGARLIADEDKSRYCTRIGRLLKRTKLDELPQLLNVLLGDMRLVGPRPVRPIFLAALMNEVPGYNARFLVPPGITGIAQLRGGYYTSPRNKLRYDVIYIRNRSAWLDVWLVLLTFIKILNRWLSMGLLILFLFFFASFVPAALQPMLRIPWLGLNVSLVTAGIIALAGWAFLEKGSTAFSLYRCPLNLPILLFVLLNVGSTVFSDDPYRAFRGSGYYVVTGFLTAFVIVNSLATRAFITWTARTVALASVLISLLGLFEIFAFSNLVVPTAGMSPDVWTSFRASSVLGSPVTLAVYLVLGIPLLLAEVTQARTQRERDFWLVCTTISFVGVFLTQTRVGLLALLVTGVVFFYRRRSSALAFASVFLLCLFLLASFGSSQFSAVGMRTEIVRWVDEKAPVFERLSAIQWLIGQGATVTAEAVAAPSAAGEAAAGPRSAARIPNMHLTLVLEHGILGWLIVMWLILSAAAAMKWAHDRAKDDRLKTLLWATVSSIAGYLVSMNSMNTFHHLPIQILFWSLIGIGLATAIQVSGHRRSNVIWRFGDAGD